TCRRGLRGSKSDRVDVWPWGRVESDIEGRLLNNLGVHGVVNTNGWNETFMDTTPLFSMSVSNLSEGEYKLGVHYLGLDGGYCRWGSVDIRIVKLAAVSPRIVTGTNFQFDVVTAFAGKRM